MAIAVIPMTSKKMVNIFQGGNTTNTIIGYKYKGSMYVSPHEQYYEYVTFNIEEYKNKNITKIQLIHDIAGNNNATGEKLYVAYYTGNEYGNTTYNISNLEVIEQKNVDSNIIGTHTTNISKKTPVIYENTSPYVVVGRYTTSSINSGSDITNRYLIVNDNIYLEITYDEPITTTTIVSTTYPDAPWTSFTVSWKTSSDYVIPNKDKLTEAEVQYKHVSSNNWTNATELTNLTSYRFNSNTFVKFENIMWRVRCKGTLSNWSPWATETIVFEGKPPTTNFNFYTEPDNPFKDILVRWTYNSSFSQDTQVNSQFRHKTSSNWTTVTIDGTENKYTLKANTYTDYTNIEMEVRVQSIYGGWSNWVSYTTDFLLYPPSAINLAPTSPQQPKVHIRLNWAYKNNDTRQNDPQIESIIEHRKIGGSWTSVTVSNNQYTLPANTYSLSDKEVEFRVKVSGKYNGVGTWSPITKFSLQSTPPYSPQLFYPVNSYPKASEDIYFQWYYSSVLGDEASNTQIQIEKNGVLEVDTLVGTGNTYIYTPDIISANYQWRVRSTNSVGEVGAWSDMAGFHTIGRPTTPAIVSHSNENLTLFNFAIINGLSWRLNIFSKEELVYTSDIMQYNLSYRLEEYLPNGEYTATLTSYQQDNESNPYIYNFTINTVVVGSTDFNLYVNNKNFIELSFQNTTGKALIYRNNKLIGVTSDNFYKDIMCDNNVSHIYFIRLIDNYNMIQSEKKSTICYSNQMLICKVNTVDNYIIPKVVESITYNTIANKTEHQFIGRDNIVVSFDNITTTKINITIVATPTETIALQRLAEENTIIFMKHIKFGTITGFFTSFNVTVGKNNNKISFTIKKGGISEK